MSNKLRIGALASGSGTNLQAIIANAAEAASVETTAQFDYYNAVAMKKLKVAMAA